MPKKETDFTVDHTIKGHKTRIKVKFDPSQLKYAASADCPVGGAKCAHFDSPYMWTYGMPIGTVDMNIGDHLSQKHS